MATPKDRHALGKAALEGLLSGLALLACAGNRAPAVRAPMEAAPQTSAATGARGGPPPLPLGIASQSAKSCCSGKNECKGKSGCRSSLNECRGQNECKGKGTSCNADGDDDDEDDDGSYAASPHNCCAGKNTCKGKSGCRTAKNTRGPGMNDCKGQGTACPRP
jgi:hypothetical protein